MNRQGHLRGEVHLTDPQQPRWNFNKCPLDIQDSSATSPAESQEGLSAQKTEQKAYRACTCAKKLTTVTEHAHIGTMCRGLPSAAGKQEGQEMTLVSEGCCP